MPSEATQVLLEQLHELVEKKRQANRALVSAQEEIAFMATRVEGPLATLREGGELGVPWESLAGHCEKMRQKREERRDLEFKAGELENRIQGIIRDLAGSD